MKVYNFEDDKMAILLEDFEEISDMKSIIYSEKLRAETNLSEAIELNNDTVIDIMEEQLDKIKKIDFEIYKSKNCNKELMKYIDKQCEENNIDFMYFVQICIKSYMLQCQLAKSTPRKR